VPHRSREALASRHPVHVTLRAERRLPNLRRQILFFEVRRALAHEVRQEEEPVAAGGRLGGLLGR